MQEGHARRRLIDVQAKGDWGSKYPKSLTVFCMSRVMRAVHAQLWFSDMQKPLQIWVVPAKVGWAMCKLRPMRASHIWHRYAVVCRPRAIHEVQVWWVVSDLHRPQPIHAWLRLSVCTCHDWHHSSWQMSPGRYPLKVVDVACLKSTRLG